MSTPQRPPSTGSRERNFHRLLTISEKRLHYAKLISNRFSRWRLALFLIGLVATIIPYHLGWFHTGNAVLLGFVGLFFVVAGYHTRLEDRMQRLRHWRAIKSTNLARRQLDWNGIPAPDVPAQEAHAYAPDLDLLGPRSLFALLNTTLSTNGQDQLLTWIVDQNATPPTPDAWQARQNLVKELARLPILRDRIVLEANLLGEGMIDGSRILTTLQAPAGFLGLFPILILQSLLAGTTMSFALAEAAGWLPTYWPFSFTLYVLVYFFTAGRAAPAFSRVLSLHHELKKLGVVFQVLTKRSFTHTPFLGRLCAPLRQGQNRPDLVIRRFAGISHALSIRAHPLVHLGLNALIPWDLAWTYRLERLQRQVLPDIPTWLNTLGELEAAAALGNFAGLNPTYAWPTLIERDRNGKGAVFLATRLSHPLIPSPKRIANDVELRGIGRLLLITGSNMSGKSTFLRTIGINACLAQAGAPVCAETFEASWLRVYCCIRVDDSLDAGLSFFYAEVKRLKRLLDAVQESTRAPVLFLIDEIFKGTNNRERVIGSRAFIKSLAKSNGFGLVTTHDLELAELEKEIPTASNAHFREQVEEKTLAFDYRLRPGPCPTTNALRIMAFEGLPVPEDEVSTQDT